jgi:hypothetical protein
MVPRTLDMLEPLHEHGIGQAAAIIAPFLLK